MENGGSGKLGRKFSPWAHKIFSSQIGRKSNKVKLPWGSFTFTSLLFLPNWEEKILWAQGENFLPSFPLLPFSSHYQTVKNSSFPSYIFHSPKIYPTKHNVSLSFVFDLVSPFLLFLPSPILFSHFSQTNLFGLTKSNTWPNYKSITGAVELKI